MNDTNETKELKQLSVSGLRNSVTTAADAAQPSATVKRAKKAKKKPKRSRTAQRRADQRDACALSREIRGGNLLVIDPGVSDGCAAYETFFDVEVVRLKPLVFDLVWQLRSIIEANDITTVVVEDVGYHRHGNGASSSCELARQCGAIDAAVVPFGIPLVKIDAKQWQSETCGALPSDYDKRKARIYLLASRWYPELIQRRVNKRGIHGLQLFSGDAVALYRWACALRTRGKLPAKPKE